MSRKLAALAFTALAIIGVAGFLNLDLARQQNWDSGAWPRIAIFALVYFVLALLPTSRLVAPLLLGALAFWTIYRVGPLPLLAVAFLFGSCYLTGKRIAKASDVLTQIVVGVATLVFCVWWALHLPINYRWAYWLVLAIPYLSLRAVPRLPAIPRSIGTVSLGFFLAVHWVMVLKPEISADGLSMHLALPMEVARAHEWHFDVTREAWAVMPAAGDSFFTAAYMLGGEPAAQLANLAMFFLLCGLIVFACRTWLDVDRACLAAALFASTPLTQLVTGSLFVENVWAVLFVCGAFAVFRKDDWIAALLLGSSITGKLVAMVFGGLAALPLLARRRFAAMMLGTAIALTPYAYAAWKTRNPIFPFANHIFHSPQYQDKEPFRDDRYTAPIRWSSPFDLTFHSDRYLEGQPGATGFQYWLLLLPAILVRRKREALLGLSAVLVLLIALPNLRYMYAALPLLSIAIGAIFELSFAVPIVITIMAANFYFFPSAGWYHRDFVSMTRIIPERALIADLAAQPTAFFSTNAVADFRGRAFTDTWHHETYWKRVRDSRTPEEAAGVLRSFGIQQIVAPANGEHDFPIVETLLDEWAEPTPQVAGTLRAYRLRETASAPTRGTAILQPGEYDDLDHRIAYRGSWYHDRQFAEPRGHTLTYTNVVDATATFHFEGSSIEFIFTKAPNRGSASISIDGVRQLLSENGASVEWQSKRVLGPFAPGVHRFELRVEGGAYIDIDAIVVR